MLNKKLIILIRALRTTQRFTLIGIATILVGLISVHSVQAQQEPLFTQFAYNKLAFNPAYAGTRKSLDLTALYRYQWAGFEGAPQTATLSAHMPVSDGKYGFGLTVYSDRHGIISQSGLFGAYAYRVPLGEGKLAVGLSAGVELYQANVLEITGGNSTDPNLQSDINNYLPNAGIGIYYHQERFFAGISVPKLMENSLTKLDFSNGNFNPALQARHFYGMGGYVFDLNESLKLRAVGLVRYTQNSPISFDVSTSLLMMDRIWMGAGYRHMSSVTFNMEYALSPGFNLGYSYDLNINELGRYTQGSHEIMLNYAFDLSKAHIITPRDIAPNYF